MTTILALFALFLPLPARALELRAETGLVSTGYNTFAIPNPAGTRTSVSESGSSLFFRGSVRVPLSDRSSLRFLAAPLSATYSLVPATALRFNDITVPAGAPTEVRYRFDSYRAAYLYRFPLGSDLTAQVGGVAKLRVAKISVRGGGFTSEYPNTGFVPLLNLGLTWAFTGPWELRLDVDGAAAKQGRAVDGSLEVFHRIGEKGSGLSAGYRILEGGAENEKVYTFARFQYAFLAGTYSF